MSECCGYDVKKITEITELRNLTVEYNNFNRIMMNNLSLFEYIGYRKKVL